MCINSVSAGKVLLPSKSTSRPPGKGPGSHRGQYSILPLYTDPLGCLDMLVAYLNSDDLHLVTFTIDMIASMI